MTTAAQRLALFDVTMDQAHTWVLEHIESPLEILAAAQALGLTNAMLGEIAGWPQSPVDASLVKTFFSLYGFDSSVLDPIPTVVSVGSPTADEGAPLVFEVVLSAETSTTTVFPLGLSVNGASAFDFGSYSLDHGVIFNGTGLEVPAGVVAFSLTLNTVNDALAENAESITFTVGGVAGTGTIGTNDQPVAVTVASVGSNEAFEGSAVEHVVTLSATTASSTQFDLALSGIDTTAGDFGGITASNGVIVTEGAVIVPSGVSAFSVFVATADDAVDEDDEDYSIQVGTHSAAGTIHDNDSPAQAVTVAQATGGSSAEGTDVHFTVTLSAMTGEETHFTFTPGGTATPAVDWIGVYNFSNGVGIVGQDLVVPTGVSSFSFDLITSDDAADELDEIVTFDMNGILIGGIILDNDEPAPTTQDIIPTAYLELVNVLHLNTRSSGALTNASIKAAVLQANGNDVAHYEEVFDPTGIDGFEDGTWTTEELGFSHLGNLPATSETLQSLFYGTYLYLAGRFDASEGTAISDFLGAHQAELDAGNEVTAGLFVDLILDALIDAGDFPPDAFPSIVLSQVLVPVVSEMIATVVGGGDISLFDSLF